MKSKKGLLTLAALSIAVLSTGCANMNNARAQQEQEKMAAQDVDRLVQRRLVEAAASIDSTLKLIERLERGSGMSKTDVEVSHTAADVRLPTGVQNAVAQDPLGAQLKVDWTGPADEFLQSFAQSLGLSFKQSGTRRALPNVAVKAEKQTARSILEQVGTQIDNQADVVLVRTTSPMQLELRYKK